MKPLAIIGLDPGATSAYAIIDLETQLIKTHSSKELSLPKIISQIIELCQPVIVSTDKAKLPSLVEEFARKIGTEIVVPKEDLKKEEKRELLKRYQHSGKDDHQRDCLAAALYAYKKYAGKLNKINRFLHEHELGDKRREFTNIALHQDLHFSLIKEILTQPSPESKVMQQVIEEERITKTDFLKLYEKLSLVKDEKRLLKKKLQQLQQKINNAKRNNRRLKNRDYNFNQKVDHLFSFKEQRFKEAVKEINQLKEELVKSNKEKEDLLKFVVKTKDYLLIKKLSNLGKEEFNVKKNLLQIKENDYLWVNQPEIFSEQIIAELKGKSIKLISDKKFPALLSKQFQTILLKRKFQQENNHFALIKDLEVDSKDFIEGIIEEYRQRRGLGEK